MKIRNCMTPKIIDFWIVPSHSKSTVMYKVSIRDDGTWDCSCPGFRLHKRVITCRHIRDKIKELNENKNANK